MRAESWARVEELFQAALDKAPENRSEFLLRACSDDPELRTEVESLLFHAASADSFLENGPLSENCDVKPVFMPGQRLQRFEVIEMIGRGGMGEVYRARDTRLARDVAIKALRSPTLSGARSKGRFLHEAQAASALNHPNIVTVHDIGEADGVPFIAMEYVAGETLAMLITSGHISVHVAVGIAIQIAAALDKAHGAGIIHRDLKPGNVMITPEGAVKVLDFGLAKLTNIPVDGQAAAWSITEMGLVAGTVDYMSPEQAEGKALDVRSDIFSFGSVLYEMLARRRPFQASSGISTLAAILSKQPAELPAAVPASLRHIVRQCLRKDRDQRYQNIGAVKRVLEEVKLQLEPRSRSSFVRQVRPWFALAAAICAIAAFFAVRQIKKTQAPPLQVVPFTSYPGAERHPSFSPDGNEIAFSWNGDKQDNYDIYVKQIGSSTPLRLTTDPEDDLSPAFSPDGRSIGFVRVDQGRGIFMVVPALGGPERTVAEIPVPPCAEAGCNLFSWFADGKHIVTAGLMLLSTESGEVRPLTSPPDKTAPDEAPAVSPDGRSVAFVRMPDVQMEDVWLVALDKNLHPRGSPRPITKQKFNPAPFSLDPFWMPEGSELLFSDSQHIWRVPVSGNRSPEQLPFEGLSPTVSRSGSRLAYMRFYQQLWNMSRLPLESPGHAAGVAAPFAMSTQGDMNPQYSSDGKRVAFESARTGEERIWIVEADGSNVRRLFVEPDMYEGSPRWSPDGKLLAFDSDSTGQWNIYTVPANGGRANRLTNDSGGHNVPTWSRDGNWIYFASTHSGRSEIWKIPSQGGQAAQVTKNGGFEGWESLHAKTLYFTKDGSGDRGLWRMPLNGSGSEVQIVPSIQYWSFGVTPNGLYYLTQARPGRKPSIQYLSFATQKAITVLNLRNTGDAGLTVSPDGRSLLYVETTNSNADIMLVENFH